MTESLLLLRGVVIGIAMALPVGAIGMICIRQTLAFGPSHGYVCGFGAATADAFYGAVAAFGLGAISSFILEYESWLRLLGGIFLLVIAARALTHAPNGQSSGEPGSASYTRGYLSGLVITLTNPATLIGFIAIFAVFGVTDDIEAVTSSAILVAGIAMGSSAWFCGLCFGVARIRDQFSTAILVRINVVTGLLLAGLGCYALITSVPVLLPGFLSV